VHLLIPTIGFGLVTAAMLAIASVGFTLQFAITNILNLAYADVMTASAFVGYAANRNGFGIWYCIVFGALFGAVFSMLLNRFVYTPFIRRGTKAVGAVLVSIAVGLMIQYTVVLIWSPNFVSYEVPNGSPVRIGSMIFTPIQLGIIGIAAISMLLVHALLAHTKLGKAMRATAANATLARASGIPTDRVVSLTWLISGGLCGISGVVFALSVISFTPFSEQTFLVIVIAAAVLGGIGRPYGAILGALTIGIGTELAALVLNPAFKEVVAFFILGVVLLLRPQGILSGSLGRETATA
jgi:branched-subunit amino acid ABC-type transport system permease component